MVDSEILHVSTAWQTNSWDVILLMFFMWIPKSLLVVNVMFDGALASGMRMSSAEFLLVA